jgi:hypothetical protein
MSVSKRRAFLEFTVIARGRYAKTYQRLSARINIRSMERVAGNDIDIIR